jgi:hypothetical protein
MLSKMLSDYGFPGLKNQLTPRPAEAIIKRDPAYFCKLAYKDFLYITYKMLRKGLLGTTGLSK